MRKLKRGYLKSSESKTLINIVAIMQTLQGIRTLEGKPDGRFIWDVWKERGIMSAAAGKHLKMAYTYLCKFMAEIMVNLDDQTVHSLEKKIEKFECIILDDFTKEKIQRDINNHLKYVVMERESFENIIQEVAQVNCVGCDKDYRGCHLAKAFDEVLIRGVEEETNCPYACDLSRFGPERRETYEKLKQRLRENNQFIRD